MTKTQIAQHEARVDDEGSELELEEDAVEAMAKAGSVAEREAAMTRRPKGVSRKALARSNGDWLAIELAKLVLDERSKLVVARYEAILDANGVPHAKYKREGKGWEGRLRMSTRLALQRVVAEDGELVLPDGATIAAPRAWVAKHAN